MDREIFTDTHVFCPGCGSNTYGMVTFVVIPEHRRVWTEESFGEPDTEFVEHWGEVRDYKCRDCDIEWTMAKPDHIP